METIKVGIECSESSMPTLATKYSVGYDLRAYLVTENGTEYAYTLQPGERKLFKTGVKIALPKGYEAQIRSRSGLANKLGVFVLNGIGTIDSDYRGDIGVILYNSGDAPFSVTNNMRIAQLIFNKIEYANFKTISNINEYNTETSSDRQSGGFGSTGE